MHIRWSRTCQYSLMALLAHLPAASAAEPSTQSSMPPLSIAAQSPFLANGTAILSDGTLFLGLPRWTGMNRTPSLTRLSADGQLHPFPGNQWNSIDPSVPAEQRLVMVNSVHAFADDSLWVVDQGVPGQPGTQKVLQFDPQGKLLRDLRFDTEILPVGATLNDLRIDGDWLYLTDSGMGGIIVHNLKSGQTLRRLSATEAMRQPEQDALRGGQGRVMQDADRQLPQVHSDMLEISPDGDWLYVATPVGPLVRVPTSALQDPEVAEATLEQQVEKVADIPTIGGTAIDDLGNLYLADAEHRQILVHAPDGREAVLVSDPRLISPDAPVITAERELYIPVPQTEYLPQYNDGQNGQKSPFVTYRLSLPEAVDGIPLGGPVAQGPGL